MIKLLFVYTVIGSIIAFMCCIGGFIENMEEYISSEKNIPKWVNVPTIVLIIVILWPVAVISAIINWDS